MFFVIGLRSTDDHAETADISGPFSRQTTLPGRRRTTDLPEPERQMYCCNTLEFDHKVVDRTQWNNVRQDEEYVALACAVFERYTDQC